MTHAEIDALVAERAAARGRGNFAEADRIRERLRSEKIIVEDRADGTSNWRRDWSWL